MYQKYIECFFSFFKYKLKNIDAWLMQVNSENYNFGIKIISLTIR